MFSPENSGTILGKTALDEYVDNIGVFARIEGEIRCKYCYFSISGIDANTKKKLVQHY